MTQEEKGDIVHEKKVPEFLEASYESDLYYQDSGVIERLRGELRMEAEKNGVDLDDYKFDSITYETRAYRRNMK